MRISSNRYSWPNSVKRAFFSSFLHTLAVAAGETSGATVMLLPTIWVTEFQSTPWSIRYRLVAAKIKVLGDIFITFIYEDQTEPSLSPLFFCIGLFGP